MFNSFSSIKNTKKERKGKGIKFYNVKILPICCFFLLIRLILRSAFDISAVFLVTTAWNVTSLKPKNPCVLMALQKAFFQNFREKEKIKQLFQSAQSSQMEVVLNVLFPVATGLDGHRNRLKSSCSWAAASFFFLFFSLTGFLGHIDCEWQLTVGPFFEKRALRLRVRSWGTAARRRKPTPAERNFPRTFPLH